MCPILAVCLCLALAYRLETSRLLEGRQHKEPSDTAREPTKHAHTIHGGATDTRRGARHSGTVQRHKEFTPPEHVHYLERRPAPERPGSRKPQVSSAENLCPFSTPTTKRWYQSGEGGSEPSSNSFHRRCNSCRPTTTTTTTTTTCIPLHCHVLDLGVHLLDVGRGLLLLRPPPPRCLLLLRLLLLLPLLLPLLLLLLLLLLPPLPLLLRGVC